MGRWRWRVWPRERGGRAGEHEGARGGGARRARGGGAVAGACARGGRRERYQPTYQPRGRRNAGRSRGLESTGQAGPRERERGTLGIGLTVGACGVEKGGVVVGRLPSVRADHVRTHRRHQWQVAQPDEGVVRREVVAVRRKVDGLIDRCGGVADALDVEGLLVDEQLPPLDAHPLRRLRPARRERDEQQRREVAARRLPHRRLQANV